MEHGDGDGVEKTESSPGETMFGHAGRPGAVLGGVRRCRRRMGKEGPENGWRSDLTVAALLSSSSSLVSVFFFPAGRGIRYFL